MDAAILRFLRDLEALAAPLPARIGVALSGGADSLALLLLARGAFPDSVRAATVDHGLRPESGAEAAAAGAVCSGLGIPHKTLLVSVPRIGEGVQASARAVRYEALGTWMREEGIALLLTAHHADDQAETLLMRLLRGSGVGGLAGIRACAAFPAAGEGARLCRPLLGWRRAELEAVVRSAGLEPVDDPSNCDEAYDRVRLRRQLSEAEWLDPLPLARSAACLAEAEQALEWTAELLAAERIARADSGVTLDPGGVPSELLRRLVLSCLRAVDAGASPRGEALTAAIASLRDGRTTTLAGIKATGGPLWRFEPAPPRRGQAR